MGVLEGSGPQPRGGAAPCPPAGAPGLTGARGGAGGPTESGLHSPPPPQRPEPRASAGQGASGPCTPGAAGALRAAARGVPPPCRQPRGEGRSGAGLSGASRAGCCFPDLCLFLLRKGSPEREQRGRAAGGGGEWRPLRSVPRCAAPCRSAAAPALPVPCGGGRRRGRAPPRAGSGTLPAFRAR